MRETFPRGYTGGREGSAQVHNARTRCINECLWCANWTHIWELPIILQSFCRLVLFLAFCMSKWPWIDASSHQHCSKVGQNTVFHHLPQQQSLPRTLNSILQAIFIVCLLSLSQIDCVCSSHKAKCSFKHPIVLVRTLKIKTRQLQQRSDKIRTHSNTTSIFVLLIEGWNCDFVSEFRLGNISIDSPHWT